MFSGPIAGFFILDFFHIAPLLASFLGSRQMVPTGLSICHSLVKKWASTNTYGYVRHKRPLGYPKVSMIKVL
jgi:hypothetical protein